jgi:hypothetical protein
MHESPKRRRIPHDNDNIRVVKSFLERQKKNMEKDRAMLLMSKIIQEERICYGGNNMRR